MLSNPEKFNDYSISFTDFLSVLMGGAEKMNEMGITISTYAENRVYEVYDEKTGKFTNYISEIRQIYSP